MGKATLAWQHQAKKAEDNRCEKVVTESLRPVRHPTGSNGKKYRPLHETINTRKGSLQVESRKRSSLPPREAIQSGAPARGKRESRTSSKGDLLVQTSGGGSKSHAPRGNGQRGKKEQAKSPGRADDSRGGHAAAMISARGHSSLLYGFRGEAICSERLKKGETSIPLKSRALFAMERLKLSMLLATTEEGNGVFGPQ